MVVASQPSRRRVGQTMVAMVVSCQITRCRVREWVIAASQPTRSRIRVSSRRATDMSSSESAVVLVACASQPRSGTLVISGQPRGIASIRQAAIRIVRSRQRGVYVSPRQSSSSSCDVWSSGGRCSRRPCTCQI